ncbi:FecR family protein [Bizionia sediminis]|uniref:FecR family protein n=1 Tax=Bizionia sediminis TaxID=1737064 RepID=A0ABW5KN65_9FLAO
MNKDALIQKWLQGSLNSEEEAAFKALEDYEALMKLTAGLQHFKAPHFNESAVYEAISTEISKASKKQSRGWKFIAKIAALLAVSVSVYYYSTTLNTQIATATAEKTQVVLPDASEVTLNALTTLSYNKKNWKNKRSLTLHGEAYFKVAKGSAFTVETSSGQVTVLGTEFSVENRADYFEVICFEGAVEVVTNTSRKVLHPSNQFVIINDQVVPKKQIATTAPAWINNESAFTSTPLTFVLKELERQYAINIKTENLDTNILFTGVFTHTNLELALKAITVPLNITYTKTTDFIILHGK